MDDETQELIKKLKTGNYEVREKAASKLGEIGGVSVITALIDVLKTKKDITGVPEAIRSLVKIGESAIPALIDLLTAEEWIARESAAKALGEIGDARAIPYLIERLKKERYECATEKCAEALDKIGFDKIPGTEEEKMKIKVFALLVLKRSDGVIGMGEPVVPVLIEILKDGNPKVVNRVAEALRQIGFDKIPEKERMQIKVHCTLARISTLDDGRWKIKINIREPISALEKIKEITNAVMKLYKGKKDRRSLAKRAEILRELEQVTKQIQDKMNSSDKKKFPVKRQEVRRTPMRKVMRNG